MLLARRLVLRPAGARRECSGLAQRLDTNAALEDAIAALQASKIKTEMAIAVLQAWHFTERVDRLHKDVVELTRRQTATEKAGVERKHEADNLDDRLRLMTRKLDEWNRSVTECGKALFFFEERLLKMEKKLDELE
jgi:chromosome segregation ATPase